MESQSERRKPTNKKKRRGRPRARPLRGELLVKAAEVELGRMANLSPKTEPINISSLARRLQVTRQAIYNNGIESVINEYAELQRVNFSANVEAIALRRPLQVRVAELEEQNADLHRKLVGLIEKWATVEYNAKMLGINADELFAPMPAPERR